MAYTFQADVWCDKCGERTREDITRKGNAPKDPEDEHTYDSDDFPKYYDAECDESDGPQNCASGNCADDGLHGTFLENPLTTEGYRYLQGMLNRHGSKLPVHAEEWAEFYNFEYHTNEWANAHEWLASKELCEYLTALMDKIDGDTIQDTFQDDMTDDGYFKASGWYSPEYDEPEERTYV